MFDNVRKLSALAVAGMVLLWALQVVPVGAQTTVPENPNIVDPAGDANYTGSTSPVDAGTVSDLLAVWFTNDAEKINAHIQTEAPPPSLNSAYRFGVFFVPTGGTEACVHFRAYVEGPTYAGGTEGTFVDDCGDERVEIDGEITIEELEDGTGVTTISILRSEHAAFAPGSILATPQAEVRNLVGVDRANQMGFGPIDDTEVGTDYQMQDEKKKCPKKKKGKKKKKCPKPKPSPTSTSTPAPSPTPTG